MFVSYQILSNLAPETPTTSQQRAADEQLGRIAAALSGVGRGRRHWAGRQARSGGSSGLTLGQLSKNASKATACGISHHAA
jgi:hypothetical protein